MWPFSRKKKEQPKTRRIMRRIVVGFIIGSAVSSIVGNKVLKERRKRHLGEDHEQ